jgi:hypothetical protein
MWDRRRNKTREAFVYSTARYALTRADATFAGPSLVQAPRTSIFDSVSR